jgi:hypothetical protein
MHLVGSARLDASRFSNAGRSPMGDSHPTAQVKMPLATRRCRCTRIVVESRLQCLWIIFTAVRSNRLATMPVI